MYFKAESVGVASYAQPTADSDGSSPFEETGKLKSVVQVVGQENTENTECEVKPEATGDTAVEDMEETVGGASDGREGSDGMEGEKGEP